MSILNPVKMKHSEKEIERLRDENKKLREIISDETNPDKQLIFMLEKKN